MSDNITLSTEGELQEPVTELVYLKQNGIDLESPNDHVTMYYDKVNGLDGITTPTYVFTGDSNRLYTEFVVDIRNNDEARLARYSDGYKLLYNTLVHDYPNQKDTWDVLLKMNEYDYKQTVLTIEMKLENNE